MKKTNGTIEFRIGVAQSEEYLIIAWVEYITDFVDN